MYAALPGFNVRCRGIGSHTDLVGRDIPRNQRARQRPARGTGHGRVEGRNQYDREVEALFSGRKADLERIIARLQPRINAEGR